MFSFVNLVDSVFSCNFSSRFKFWYPFLVFIGSLCLYFFLIVEGRTLFEMCILVLSHHKFAVGRTSGFDIS